MVALLAQHPELSAVHMHKEIAYGCEGYGGSASTVRYFLRTVHLVLGCVHQEV
jgi:hypothetical protein